jgi:hypothetical protein
MLGTDATPWMSAEDIQAALHPAVMDDGRGGGGGPVFCISARPDLGGRRAFRLVATASENRLNTGSCSPSCHSNHPNKSFGLDLCGLSDTIPPHELGTQHRMRRE